MLLVRPWSPQITSGEIGGGAGPSIPVPRWTPHQRLHGAGRRANGDSVSCTRRGARTRGRGVRHGQRTCRIQLQGWFGREGCIGDIRSSTRLRAAVTWSLKPFTVCTYRLQFWLTIFISILTFLELNSHV